MCITSSATIGAPRRRCRLDEGFLARQEVLALRGFGARRRGGGRGLVRGLAAGGAGVVVVSHDAWFVAGVATAAIAMERGRIATHEAPTAEAVHA